MGKPKDDYLMYIHNDNQQNYTFGRLIFCVVKIKHKTILIQLKHPTFSRQHGVLKNFGYWFNLQSNTPSFTSWLEFSFTTDVLAC